MDDEEITDVRPILPFEEDEATAPGVDEAVIHAEVTMEVTPVDASMNLAPTLRLPRTRVAELDQAIDDLEGLLARLDGQSVRLLAVTCLSFVSLFVPWHVVTTPGFQQAIPGIESGGVFLILLLVAEMAVIGFERYLRHRFHSLATWLRQSLVGLVIITMALALLFPGIPPELSHRTSLWAGLPALALVAQVFGFFRILPTFRRRAVARSGHKE